MFDIAVVDRARSRNGTARSGVCTSCLARYCWNATETTVNGATSNTVAPTYLVANFEHNMIGGVGLQIFVEMPYMLNVEAQWPVIQPETNRNST
jgi:hypothetical protein